MGSDCSVLSIVPPRLFPWRTRCEFMLIAILQFNRSFKLKSTEHAIIIAYFIASQYEQSMKSYTKKVVHCALEWPSNTSRRHEHPFMHPVHLCLFDPDQLETGMRTPNLHTVGRMKKRQFTPNDKVKNRKTSASNFSRLQKERNSTQKDPLNTHSSNICAPHAYDAHLLDWTISPENWWW